MTFSSAMRRLRKLPLDELLALQRRFETDPANRCHVGIWLYTPAARLALDLIARAIQERVGEGAVHA
jgi:streptomycin 6-kinase